MLYTEIIKMLDAGYTREEIMKMDEPKQEDPKQEDPKQKDPKQEDPKHEDPKQNPSTEMLGEIKGLFEDMKKEITAMNIMNSRRETVEKTGEDIIASIINPFVREEK